MTIRNAHTATDVEDLLADILNPAREHVVCVLTIPLAHDVPLFDPHEVQTQTAGFCDVWTIATGDLTRALTAGLPANADCYGGAARVYPISVDWMSRPRLSKRVMAPHVDHVEAAMDALITEIHAQAFLAGLMARRSATTHPASGTVSGFLSAGARALVTLDDGRHSTIAQELTAPEVPLSNILRVGQRVDGLLDEQLKRLMLGVPTVSEADILRHYGDGTVTLGVVTETSRQWALIALYPGVVVRLEQRDVSSNVKDLLDVLYSVGDVIRVRVVRTPQGKLGLRTLDIDDDEDVVPAFVVVGGGPEWLHEDQLNWLSVDEHVTESIESFLSRIGLEREVDETLSSNDNADTISATLPTEAPKSATPGPGVRPARNTGPIALPGHTLAETQSLKITALQARVAELERALAHANPRGMKAIQDQMRLEISELFRDRDEALGALRAEKERTTALRTQLRDARSKQVVGNDYSVSRSWFSPGPDGSQAWFRHELQGAWIERIPASDRPDHPLASFTLGEDFVASLERFTNGAKHKAFKCVVDVLVGTTELLALRRVHPLRMSDGANSPDRVRGDGAAAMRAYVEEGVASARRLHYWKLSDGTIELSNVSIHDEFDI